MKVDDLFTSENNTNWFYEKYWAAGSNSRYYTFQLVLNLLTQYRENQPDDDDLTIIETGCQRQEDDLGAGMSTSIFGEWCARYGGHLIAVDNNENHLRICAECVQPWKNRIRLIMSDSITFLKQYTGPVDLLYLDSLDAPLLPEGEKPTEAFMSLINETQQHCLNEFKAIEDRLSDCCIVLADDNQLEFGGKPKLLKPYLMSKGYTLLLDYQQSVFVKRLR